GTGRGAGAAAVEGRSNDAHDETMRLVRCASCSPYSHTSTRTDLLPTCRQGVRDERNRRRHCARQRAVRMSVAAAVVIPPEQIVLLREAQTGLWSQYRPEELATPEAFARQPDLVWQWYTWRRALVRQAAPNPAHYALVELAGRVPSFSLITQNVDSLHRRAGSRDVIELH